MNLNLQNKVFLVSGGAKGIGGAISRGLIEEGAIPVMIDPSEKEGAEILEFAEGKALQIPVRLYSPEQAKEAIDLAIQTFGRIDGLVNNAGSNDGVGLEHGSPEAYTNSVSKNLFHYYYMAHYALPHLKETKGAIVNISSKTAVTGQGNTSGYLSACAYPRVGSRAPTLPDPRQRHPSSRSIHPNVRQLDSIFPQSGGKACRNQQ
jgi:L-fucose dehydrogenase